MKEDNGPGAAKQPWQPADHFSVYGTRSLLLRSMDSPAPQYDIAEDCKLKQYWKKKILSMQ